MSVYPMPLVRIEVALQALINKSLSTLLIKRAEDPFIGAWALPGGVVRTDLDASLDSAAARVLSERLLVAPTGLTQLVAIGSAGREPRGPDQWGLSIVYRGLVDAESLKPSSGKRIEDWAWFGAEELPPQSLFAFDHSELVERAISLTRHEFGDLRFPRGLIPEQFTLTELQGICEAVLSQRLDKSSFRRKLRDRGVVEMIEGSYQTGKKNRPAGLYRLVKKR